jgi:hypothetical protein
MGPKNVGIVGRSPSTYQATSLYYLQLQLLQHLDFLMKDGGKEQFGVKGGKDATRELR